jgi:putative flavoprotein involved in K+ transport
MATQEHVETLVIGGGQAGLAVAYHLKSKRREFVILDANERVGDSWRKRWPTLRLYSPATADGLPGMPFPSKRYHYPTGLEMADYLELYATRFELPVRTGTAVDALEREGETFVAVAGEHRISAENVVVASGVFQHDRPHVPGFADDLERSIRQIHSADYRGPEQLQPGPVLVVGAAHSGGDIALEVAQAGHDVILSGPDTGQVPFDVDSPLACVVFPVLRFVATRVLTVSTPIGRKARSEIRTHGGPLIRVKRSDLTEAGVDRVLERTVGVDGGKPQLGDDRIVDVANVVWCTGFRNDYSWIRFPFPIDEDGYPEQQRGAVRATPGLYFAGLPFLHSFASMLILGAGRDGERVAKHIAGRSRAATRRRPAVVAEATG